MFKAKLFPIDKKKFLSNLPELTLLLAEGLDLEGTSRGANLNYSVILCFSSLAKKHPKH